MLRFAYLVMAHDKESQLIKLLSALDYKENDIYVHIDKKNNTISKERLKTCVTKANIYIYKKYKITWGCISQVKCQLFLLKQATKQFHDYYHVLSGSDLPIKSHAYIQNFFLENSGKEFIHFENNTYTKKNNGTKYHLFFGMARGAKNQIWKRVCYRLDKTFVSIQNKIGVERKLFWGSNWCSITHKLATDVVENEKRLLRKVLFTISSDEIFLQSFVGINNSKYELFYKQYDDNYLSIMRYIDWNRGEPYIWREKDFDELIKSPYLYARKFDENVDMMIIDRIKEYIE